MATAKEPPRSTPSSSTCRYDCPICLEPVRSPRGLPCLHTFCQDCLQSYINESFTKDSKKVACPICRKKITEPEPGLPHDKWARTFPLNYFLLMADEEKQDENSQVPAEECKACLRAHKVTPATHYCKNCTETICESCKALHTFVRTLLNHDIISLIDYMENPAAIQNVDETCQTHAGKIVEVFCLDHKQLCCSICFATQHRHCKDVKSIDECIDDPSMDTIIKNVTQKLEELAVKLEKEISSQMKVVDRLTKSKKSASHKMNTLVDAAKKNIDILHDKFEADLATKFSFDLDKINSILNSLRGLRSSIVCDKQMLQAMEKNGTKKQMFVSQEKVTSQLTEQLRLISDVAKAKLVSSYDVNAKFIEDVCELKSLSSLKAIEEGQSGISENLVRELSFCTETCFGALPILPTSLYWSTEWKFKLPDYCYVATFLKNNLALITKKSVFFVFNEDGSVKFKHELPYTGEPAGICSTDVDNEVYISFREKKVLKRYNISSSSIAEVGEIRLKGVAEGFFFVDDKIVHASRSNIYISSISGDLIKTIPASTVSGPCVGFLTWSYSSRTFYHIVEGSQLICRDLDGSIIHQISLTGSTFNPRGIGVDFQGNTYICCHEENKLLQISHKDFSIREISEIPSYTISFHPDGNSFAVVDFSSNLAFYKLQL